MQVKVHIVVADLSDAKAVDRIFNELPDDFREVTVPCLLTHQDFLFASRMIVLQVHPLLLTQVDILVNNAGLALGTSPVHVNDVADAIAMVNTNIISVIQLTKYFTTGMVKRNRGHVVNISSIAGHYPYPGGEELFCIRILLRMLTHDLTPLYLLFQEQWISCSSLRGVQVLCTAGRSTSLRVSLMSRGTIWLAPMFESQQSVQARSVSTGNSVKLMSNASHLH